jgi:cytoskeletal protein CcmA (bactofilin family)
VFKRRDETTRPDPQDAPSVNTVGRFLRPSLGVDTSVTGKLSFEAPTRIDGKLRGEVRAGDLLVIGETGLVDGIVRAARLVVRGQVHGEIRDATHVEIAAGAMVTGTIEARSLTVHTGAILRADVKVEPPHAATVHVLRRPTGADGAA